MTVATRSPMRELDTLRQRFDTLISEMTRFPRAFSEMTALPLDMQEKDTEIVVTASMPGYSPENITVEINRGMLTMHAESTQEREEKTGTWHMTERQTGSIHRSVTLPTPVDERGAVATVDNGVLTVTIPKAPAQEPMAHRVEVKAAQTP